VVSVGVLLLALNVGRDQRWTKVATWSFLVVGAVGAAVYYLDVREQTSFLQTGGLFGMWVVALAYGQALLNTGLSGRLRLALLALAVAWVYKATFGETWWFSGWGPALLVLPVVTFFRSKRAAVLLVLAAAVVVYLHWDIVYDAVFVGAENKGDLIRLQIWQQ